MVIQRRVIEKDNGGHATEHAPHTRGREALIRLQRKAAWWGLKKKEYHSFPKVHKQRKKQSPAAFLEELFPELHMKS